MSPRCGIVVVSHSTRLAEGVVELAAQMAPDVVLRAAGGDDDGGLGTSMTKVEEALSATLDEAGAVVVATDLGSATMIAETTLELLAEDQQSRVLLADGPLVEGVVAAAVAAQGGADAPGVRAALEAAADSFARATGPAGPDQVDGGPSEDGTTPAEVTAILTLVNEVGLHARPAAQLARTVARFDAWVTVEGVDATSVLALMGLGLARDDQMHLRAGGPQAREAVTAVEHLVADRFGERA